MWSNIHTKLNWFSFSNQNLKSQDTYSGGWGVRWGSQLLSLWTPVLWNNFHIEIQLVWQTGCEVTVNCEWLWTLTTLLSASNSTTLPTLVAVVLIGYKNNPQRVFSCTELWNTRYCAHTPLHAMQTRQTSMNTTASVIRIHYKRRITWVQVNCSVGGNDLQRHDQDVRTMCLKELRLAGRTLDDFPHELLVSLQLSLGSLSANIHAWSTNDTYCECSWECYADECQPIVHFRIYLRSSSQKPLYTAVTRCSIERGERKRTRAWTI